MAYSDWEEHLFLKALRDQQKKDAFIRGWLEAMHPWQREREELARWAEWCAARILRSRGWPVHPQTARSARCDLLVGRARVEVKASRCHLVEKRGRGYWRFAADIRSRADVVLWCAVNGRPHWFVLPWHSIGRRCNIQIWREDPRDYGGRWARFLEAWPVVDEVLREKAGDVQLPLFDLEACYA